MQFNTCTRTTGVLVLTARKARRGEFKLPNPTKGHFILTQIIYHCITVSFGERKTKFTGIQLGIEPGTFRLLECPTSNPEGPGFDSQLDPCRFFFLSPKLTSSCFCLHRTFPLHYCVSPFTLLLLAATTVSKLHHQRLRSAQSNTNAKCPTLLTTQASARYENTTYNHQSTKTNTGYGICMHPCVHTCQHCSIKYFYCLFTVLLTVQPIDEERM